MDHLLVGCLALAVACPAIAWPSLRGRRVADLSPPPFLEVCSRSDPTLNKCIKHSINRLIRSIKSGSPRLGLPATDPLTVDFLEVDQGAGNVSLQLALSDVRIQGLGSTGVLSVKANLEDGKLEVASKTPQLDVQGQFDAKGGVLSFPVVSNGLFWLNMTDVTSIWILYFGSEETPGEPPHLRISRFDVDIVPSDVRYSFGELLDGDNRLGAAMNMFLNENSHEIYNAVRPRITQIFSKLFSDIANQVLGSFPAQVLLPD